MRNIEECEENDIYTLPNILTSFDNKAAKSFYQKQYVLLSDIKNKKNHIFKYLTRYSELIKTKQLILVDSLGIKQIAMSECPAYLTNPRPFSYDMYPLNDSHTMFAINRPYNYLATFSVKSFQSSNSKDIRYKGIQNMIEDQCQSRFSNIWRLLMSIVYTIDCLFSSDDNVILWYTTLLLKQYKSLPFYERRGKFNITNDTIPSILPTLLYMLMSIGTELSIGNINMGDAVFCINHYLKIANDSYYDTKLRIKSAARNWVSEALHNLKCVRVIRWGQDCNPLYIYEKDTSECEDVMRFFEVHRSERVEKLPNYFSKYIDNAIKIINSFEQVIQLLRVCHAATNDRTYYKTLVELSLDKAIKPNLYQTIVQAPITTCKDKEGNPLAFKFQQKGSVESVSQNMLIDTAVHIAHKVKKVDFDYEWFRFLTTSSAGKKLEEQALSQYSSTVKKLHNKRVVRAAIDADKYRNVLTIYDSIKDPTLLVVRQQNDRRQRAIAGLTNPKLFCSFPSYALGKMYYPIVNAVAQGKQLGNILDIALLLNATSDPHGLCSSVDISGMDTSIQPAVRKIYDSFTYTLARKLTNTRFGPWYDGMRDIISVDDDGHYVCSQELHSGIFQALLSHTHTMQSATTYISALFGKVQGKEGTFESGRADTSTHHTVLLSSVLRASRVLYRQSGMPDNARVLKVMGDDIFATYGGFKQDELMRQALFDSEQLNNVGFKTTLDISRNHAIFLQQQCILGRFFGLACRVSLFTSEHVKAIKSLTEAGAELRALRDDILSRAVNPDGLSMLVASIALWCLSRHTIRLSQQHRKKILDALTVQGIRYQCYDVGFLVSIYYPPIWIYMRGGCELPAPMIYYTHDGENFITLRQSESAYTPAGPWRRKLVVDLDLAFNDGIYNKHTFGTSPKLAELQLNAAQFLIDLDIIGVEKAARISEQIKIETHALADSLNSLTDSSKRDKSLRAEFELRNKGYAMPKSLIYAYQTEIKILQIIESGEIDIIGVNDISDKIYEKILELRANTLVNAYRIRPMHDDELHLWRVAITQHRIIPRYDYDYSRVCPFVFSMERVDSIEHNIFNILGPPHAFEGSLKRELSILKGKFHNFRASDPTFKEAIHLYRNSPSLLPIYYDAIGANDETRRALNKAIAFYAKFGSTHYHYVTSPRQLFFLSEDIEPLSNTYIHHDLGYFDEIIKRGISKASCEKSFRAFELTCAYLHLLSSNTPQEHKITIHFDQLLINRFATMSIEQIAKLKV